MFWLLRGIAAPSVSASTAVPAEMCLHFTSMLVTLKPLCCLVCFAHVFVFGEGKVLLFSEMPWIIILFIKRSSAFKNLRLLYICHFFRFRIQIFPFMWFGLVWSFFLFNVVESGFGYYFCKLKTWHTCYLHQCLRTLNCAWTML